MSRIITALAGGVLAAALLPGAASADAQHRAGPVVTVVATGLDNPRGLTVHHGAVYVAESGNAGDVCVGGGFCFGTTGAITRIGAGGQQRIITDLPSKGLVDGVTGGPNDVTVGPWGQLVVPFDLGGAAAPHTGVVPFGHRFGTVERLRPAPRQLGDLRAWEDAHDPDAADPSTQGKESNPFSVAVTSRNATVATDAAGNDLIEIAPDGTLRTLAVFPSQCVPTPPGPPSHPSCPAGQTRQQSVPTGVAIGPDGAFYVSELTGFPFTAGTARIWRVTRHGQPTVVAAGLTAVIDIAFDCRGQLYALQYKKNGFLSPDLTGSLVRIAKDGNHTTVLDTGLLTPTGLAFGKDGAAYVAHRGVPTPQGATPVAPHTGEVLKVRL